MATVVAVAFALVTLERWRARGRPHELAWSLSMACFALGALTFLVAARAGWQPWSFRLFYLSGGVVTVPVLAVGTVYLLAGRRWGNAIALLTLVVSAYAAGVVSTAPLHRPLVPHELNEGREVLGVAPRALAAIGSGVGALVVIGGALWSAAVLLRRGARPGPRGGLPARRSSRPHSPGQLAVANLAIAAGTLLVSLKRPFEAITGSPGRGFALALVCGLSLIFVGFLTATLDRSTGRVRAVPALSPPGAAVQPRSSRRSTLPVEPSGSSSTN